MATSKGLSFQNITRTLKKIYKTFSFITRVIIISGLCKRSESLNGKKTALYIAVSRMF